MRRGRDATRRAHRSAGWALALLAALEGCDGPARALGDSPAQAQARAGDLLGALAARFGPTERDVAFEALRPKLARAALAPSRLFDDPSAWTQAGGVTRAVTLSGAPGASRYRIVVRSDAPAPLRPGDYRAILSLKASRPGDYLWGMREALGVGPLGVDALPRATAALFEAAGALGAGDARGRVRQGLPRATAALGRLFSLEILGLARGADGATAITLVATLHPDRLQQDFPRFGRFVGRYATPLRAQIRALDDGGVDWWVAEARENTVSLRLRLFGGSLAPLEGPLRPRPDRLRLRIDYSTRAGPFRIGVRGLEGDMTLDARAERREMRVAFRKEPEWALPFLVEGFLRGSLKHPFEGEGAFFGLGIEEAPGQTLLTLDYDVAVRESWILRWLGGYVTTALTEFRTLAEEESDRFVGEAFEALREDALDLAGRPPGGGAGPVAP